MLKLKLLYFDHLLWRADSLGKTLMLGNIEVRRREGQQRMRWLDGITGVNGHEFEQTLGDSEGQGSLACCSSWGHRVRHKWATEQQQRILKGFIEKHFTQRQTHHESTIHLHCSYSASFSVRAKVSNINPLATFLHLSLKRAINHISVQLWEANGTR